MFQKNCPKNCTPSQQPTPESPEQKILQLLQGRYNETKQELNLNGTCELWQSVLEGRSWRALRRISLWYCGIGDGNVGLLAGMDWPVLREIQLNRNKITGKGIRKLKGDNFPALQILSLVSNKIGNEGLESVLTNFPHTQVLLLWENQITVQGMVSFPQSDVSQMQELSLQNNNIGSGGAKLLARTNLASLHKLNINGCNICNQGCKGLTKSHYPSLTQLQICRNSIAFPGRLAIQLNNWLHLHRIYMGQENMDGIALTHLVTVNWNKLQSSQIIQPFICRSGRAGRVQGDVGRLLAAKFYCE